MPLQLQNLCDGVPDHEFLGSSTQIPEDPTPNVTALIAKAKLALASKPKPSCSTLMRPCLTTEELRAIWKKCFRPKPQQHAPQQQSFTLNQVEQQQVTQQQSSILDQVDQQHVTQRQVTPQQHHPDLATTTSEIIPDCPLVNFAPILNVGLSELMEAVPTQWHREDTREETRASNKRIKLTAMGY